MDEYRFDTRAYPRPLRWHQWLLILLLLAFAAGARAATVYKCVSADGAIAYQSQQCPADADVHVVDLRAAPVYRPSPHYAVGQDERAGVARDRNAPQRVARRAEPVSFECRAADGEVFYRHAGCPHSIAAQLPGSTAASSIGSGAAKHAGRRAAAAGVAASVPVSSTRIAREDACREIGRAGAIGRAGHEHDEAVSTYDRNLGRDPCR